VVIELKRDEDFDALLEKSHVKPIVIFKHSTRCPISTVAYEEFRRFMDDAGDLLSGVVLVIENRSLSNRIGAMLGVRHESPQAIVVENGRQRWNASHWAITATALGKALKG
jgi:bacillithiol system protein YtxJ